MRRWESINHTKSSNKYQQGAAKSDRLLEASATIQKRRSGQPAALTLSLQIVEAYRKWRS
jgi:hypothetical protein